MFSDRQQKYSSQAFISGRCNSSVKNGLTHDYPKWSTVKSFYYRAVKNGTWEKVMDFMVKETKINAGKSENPLYDVIDSQSVKTTADADNRDYDGGTKMSYCNGYNCLLFIFMQQIFMRWVLCFC